MTEDNKKSLRELVRISRDVGKEASLVLGAFGNVSVKTPDGKYMYIKASGTELKDMSQLKGWKRLKLESVLSIISDSSLRKLGLYEREAEVTRRLRKSVDDKCAKNLRPSIESCFHALMPRYVIHLHPLAVLVYACAKKGERMLGKIFKKNNLKPLWVSYAHPGYNLAKKIEAAITRYHKKTGRRPSVMFLQNHGLLTTAENADKALGLSRRVVNICKKSLPETYPVTIPSAKKDVVAGICSAIKNYVENATGKKTDVTYFTDDTITRFSSRQDAGNLCRSASITPDELIYTQGPPVWLNKWNPEILRKKINKKKSRDGKLSAGYLIKPVGLFVTGQKNRSELLKDIICSSLIIRTLAAEFGGVRALSKEQRHFIEGIASKSSGSKGAQKNI